MLFWLCKETVNKLELLLRSVHEGRGVEEASSFARWLNFSGLIKIFEAYPQPAPLLVDGAAVRRLSSEVEAACGVIFKGGKMPYNPSTSRIDDANAKLDILLSALAKNLTPSTVHTTAAGQPALTVMMEGTSSATSRPSLHLPG